MGAEVVHEQFERRLNAGDPEGLCALYEPEAVMIERDGRLIKGMPAIRVALTGLLAIKPTITIRGVQTLGTDDVAVLVSTWVVAETGPTGPRSRIAAGPTIPCAGVRTARGGSSWTTPGERSRKRLDQGRM